ncbi:hypothetical protein [Paenibacillus sp.]|uniref:hypothetical protein n=1 Tax=Paenibacillus sp. TaxID=58172 RepID=UPI0028118976|nr:hypothetical protein [Paenibacillus sp.]
MDQEKRALIVKEIEHWQRSKLLPDQYCDFLLNLYRDPEASGTVVQQERKRKIVESNPLHWLLLIGSIGLFCYVGLHFSLFPPLLQIGVFLAVVLAAHGVSAYFRNRKPLLSYALFGVGAGALLAGGAFLLGGEGGVGATGDWTAPAFYTACCAIIWIAFGVALRVPWIHLCGWIVLMFVYSAAVNRIVMPEGWVALELSWIPLAGVFGWIGWLLSRRAKQSGAVFLILACLLWFVPETYAYAFTEQPLAVTQSLMLGKLAALGATAFFLRKLWTEWVV